MRFETKDLRRSCAGGYLTQLAVSYVHFRRSELLERGACACVMSYVLGGEPEVVLQAPLYFTNQGRRRSGYK